MSMPEAMGELLIEWEKDNPESYNKFLKICGLTKNKSEVK